MSAQVIGYLGENGVRDVRIPIGHLLDKWQGLRPLLVMVPVGGSDDEAYPVQYKLEGTDLVWQVSDADTAVAGTTKAAVRMVDDDGRVGMDEPFQVIISPNLSSGGEPPVVIKPWVDKLATLVPRAESAAERAENAAQNWESGTVPNALALDGKPPSYYLPVANLFINPDFAIAQAGYNSLHGNEYFCADRWNGTNDEISLSRNTGYITLTSTADYRQIYQKILVSDLVADAYTFAVTRRSASVASSLYLYGENANGNATAIRSVSMSRGDEWQTFVLNFTRAEVAQYTKIWCCIRNQATGAVDYKEPGLYPGTYTDKTLPPFVPPDPTLELMKCKYRYQKYRFATWAAMGSGFSSNVATAYLLFTPEVPLADDVNLSLSIPGNILYRVNGKTYNVDASTGTIINHTNMLLIQFTGLSIDSSDLNSAGFFINGGTSALSVEISAYL